MTEYSLTDLGWSAPFRAQTTAEDLSNVARITSVARDRLFALSQTGPQTLLPASDRTTAAYAVGDWVVTTPDGTRIARTLSRQTALTRRAAGTGAEAQLIAANVDTLGIVTSCNADFNEARLERFLALAASAGSLPLVILTKADLCDDPRAFARRAERLSPLVTALALNATDPLETEMLAPWCRTGQTLALVGSSGVGKSTLTNALTTEALATQGIREDDAKGRHTTTSRGLYQTRFGGWLIDTPGMRALRLTDAAEGIDAVFDDIDTLARSCRFSDCRHETEPGCAVQDAIASGALSEDRLHRWQKLRREDAHNSATLHEARARDKAFGKMVRRVMAEKHNRKG
ncbi:ribosome small subunit-dependent GTPase A [Shimia aestuarii]|uniref:ribosome small subunit-dependent GTPase A n=1 Tax=Shimia aestuarii TaxID=254406 RepID=UPI001FB533F8|nr:ribosome small subunit-dependent GTPase A [Shimia aestuarii]